MRTVHFGWIWYMPLVHVLYPLYFYVRHLLFYVEDTSGAPFSNIAMDLIVAQISSITAILLIVGMYGWYLYLHKRKIENNGWYIFIFSISLVLPWMTFLFSTEDFGLSYYIIATVLFFVILPWILFLFKKIVRKFKLCLSKSYKE